jgi:hypothetical protein
MVRYGRAVSHSAVQRSPRSYSSASLSSRSAVALSSSERASLRYLIARALVMALKSVRNKLLDSNQRARLGSWPARMPGAPRSPAGCLRPTACCATCSPPSPERITKIAVEGRRQVRALSGHSRGGADGGAVRNFVVNSGQKCRARLASPQPRPTSPVDGAGD